MSFSEDTIWRAWDRQDGHCAVCGKRLVDYNRDQGTYGAWHAHHRKPLSHDGTDSLRNCVLLCVNYPESCHFAVGHGGVSWDYYQPLSDSDLPWLFG